jgi:hypothetical protein
MADELQQKRNNKIVNKFDEFWLIFNNVDFRNNFKLITLYNCKVIGLKITAIRGKIILF